MMLMPIPLRFAPLGASSPGLIGANLEDMQQDQGNQLDLEEPQDRLLGPGAAFPYAQALLVVAEPIFLPETRGPGFAHLPGRQLQGRGHQEPGLLIARHFDHEDVMAVDIDEMDAIEALASREGAGPHHVPLMHLMKALGGQSMAVQDAVNRPDLGKRLHSQRPELPLDGPGTLLGIAGLDQPLPHLTDQALHSRWGLRCQVVRHTGTSLRPGEFGRIVALEPLIQLRLRIAQGTTEFRRALTGEVTSAGPVT
jgi:hypothetical protein